MNLSSHTKVSLNTQSHNHKLVSTSSNSLLAILLLFLSWQPLFANVCKIKQPSFGGCNDECQIINGMRDAILSGIELIPGSDEDLSAFIGLFWGPNEGPEINSKLNKIVKYINDDIAESTSATLAESIKSQYRDLGEKTYEFNELILSDASPNLRVAKLTNITGLCNSIRDNLNHKDLKPLDALPYIGAVGQLCLSLFKKNAYNYEALTGAQLNLATQQVFKKDLDYTIKEFSSLAEKSTKAAKKWRLSAIQSKLWDGGWPCGVLCNHHFGEVSDKRCTQVGAIPGHKVQYQDKCCNRPPSDYVKGIETWYKNQQKQIFNDNFIGKWGANSFPLWHYLESKNIDKKIKPQVSYATALSPFLHSESLTNESVSNNQTQVNALTAAAIKHGETVKLLKVEITKGDAIIAIRATTEIAGKKYITTTGRWGSDTVWKKIDLTGNNPTIMTGWQFYPQCAKTQTIINSKTGQLSPPNYSCEKEKVSHASTFTSPPISVNASLPYDQNFNPKPSFAPRIIGVSGMWSNHRLLYVTPIWLYQRYHNKHQYLSPVSGHSISHGLIQFDI